MKWFIVYWRYDKMVENLVLWCRSGEFKKTITQKTSVLIWLVFNLDILKSTCLSWLIGQINKCHNLISFDQFYNKKPFFSNVRMAPHWCPWNSMGGLYIMQDVIFHFQISWVSMWHMSMMCYGSMQSHKLF